ncbi:hypothetical protein C1645_736111 [Glomus cerebriforme]|uniref:Uncharacterized protein n=1 Tax=Glomus cerebriforme TaxID=658196 RepID=A0A397T601_9GLOM|nr:hypothetical protein C1645_736111 [Glomus cerebriforme]
MSSELESLKQRIIELKTENAKLRKENTMILDFKRKILEFDAERAKLKRMIIEVLRITEKERIKHNTENVKLKEKKMDNFLDEADKKSVGNSSFTLQITPSEAKNNVDYDDVYFDDLMLSLMKKGTNEVKIDDDRDCSYDNDSEEEMPDDSDDNGYNDYGGYNEYDEHNNGYYYHNERYERKSLPMMSPIISPVTA